MPKDKQETEKRTTQDRTRDEDMAMDVPDHSFEEDEILTPGYYRYVH